MDIGQSDMTKMLFKFNNADNFILNTVTVVQNMFVFVHEIRA